MFRLSLLCWLLCPALSLFSQDEAAIDSLEALVANGEKDTDSLYALHLVQLWRETAYSDAARARTYARRLINEPRLQDFPLAVATGYQRLAIVQDNAGEPDSALVNNRRALAIYDELGELRLQGIMLYNMSFIYEAAGHYDSAYYYLEEAQRRFEQNGGPREIGAVLANRASVDLKQGRVITAIELQQQAYRLFLEIGDSSRMADAEQQIAFGYEELDDYEAALVYHRRSQQQFARLGEDIYVQSAAVNVGGALVELGRIDSGKLVLTQALAEARAGQWIYPEMEALETLAFVAQLENNQTERADYASQLLALTADGNNESQRLAALYHLGDLNGDPATLREALALAERLRVPEERLRILRALGKHSGLVAYYQRANTLADSLRKTVSTRQLAELQTLYETEKRDRKIEQQESELRALENREKITQLRNQRLRLGLFLLASLLGLLAYYFYQRAARNHLQRELLAEKIGRQQKELSAHTLHLIQKNQLLEELREQLAALRGEQPGDQDGIDRLLRSIQREELVDQDWDSFKRYFGQVHSGYEENLRRAAREKLSPRELRLAALIRLGLTNAEIATMLRTSQDSLYKAKYRLRKKLPVVDKGELDDFLLKLGDVR